MVKPFEINDNNIKYNIQSGTLKGGFNLGGSYTIMSLYSQLLSIVRHGWCTSTITVFERLR